MTDEERKRIESFLNFVKVNFRMNFPNQEICLVVFDQTEITSSGTGCEACAYDAMNHVINNAENVEHLSDKKGETHASNEFKQKEKTRVH